MSRRDLDPAMAWASRLPDRCHDAEGQAERAEIELPGHPALQPCRSLGTGDGVGLLHTPQRRTPDGVDDHGRPRWNYQPTTIKDSAS